MRRGKLNLLAFNVIFLRSSDCAASPLKREWGTSMVVVGNYRNRAELRKKPRRQFHYDAKILKDKDSPPLCLLDLRHFGQRRQAQSRE